MKKVSQPKTIFAFALKALRPITLITLVTMMATLGGCSADDSSNPDGQDDANAKASSLSAKQTVAEDVAAFDTQDELGSSLTTANGRKAFLAVFNGFTGTDIRTYLDTRIHSFFSEYDVAHSNVVAANLQRSRVSDDNAKAVVGAMNIGTVVWLQGLFAGVPVAFQADGQTIPATSSRVGIMMIGPGYDPVLQRQDGSIFRYPREFRQTILLHEARHSDCTGGINRSAIDSARNSGDFDTFMANYPQRNCGHLHVICPAWHSLHGLAGCDGEAWGAYAVQALYAAAVALKAQQQGDYELAKMMQYSAVDSAGRLLYTIDSNDPKHVPHFERLLNGQYGQPDMSSTGVVNR